MLSVGQDLPEAGEELDPGPLSQGGRDVTQLHQGVQQSPSLTYTHTPSLITMTTEVNISIGMHPDCSLQSRQVAEEQLGDEEEKGGSRREEWRAQGRRRV